MSIAPSLEKMTTAEKLEAMEALWADLSREPERFESPAWHKIMLDERRAAVRAGKATYTDWDVARKRLRKKLKLG
jgi:hypothetical protein